MYKHILGVTTVNGFVDGISRNVCIYRTVQTQAKERFKFRGGVEIGKRVHSLYF